MQRGINLLRALKLTSYGQPTAGVVSFSKLALFTLLLLLGVFFVPGFVGLSLLVGILVLFAVRPQWVFYGVIAVGFFTGFQPSIANTTLHTVLGLSFFTSTITAPVGDFIAIALLLSFLFSWPFIIKHDYRLREIFPNVGWYLLFIGVALISVWRVYDHSFGAALKYWLRPMAFSYACFVILPMAFIRTKYHLQTVLWILFGVGVGIMFYGLSSLFVGSGASLFQVVPYAFFGIAPLGINHNLLAEPLVAIIPIGVALGWSLTVTEKQREKALFIKLFTGGMILVCLLTLSRAAWLSLGVEALLFAYWYRDLFIVQLKKIAQWQWVMAMLILSVIVVSVVLFSSNIVLSSNVARASMLDIAWSYFTHAPIFGYGPGTFINLLADTRYFIMEFGEPLDSHGFIQKIIVEEGLLGLTFFSLFLFSIFKSLTRATQSVHNYTDTLLVSRCFLAMVAGAVVFQLFNTSYFASTMWLPIGIALAGADLIKRKII